MTSQSAKSTSIRRGKLPVQFSARLVRICLLLLIISGASVSTAWGRAGGGESFGGGGGGSGGGGGGFSGGGGFGGSGYSGGGDGQGIPLTPTTATILIVVIIVMIVISSQQAQQHQVTRTIRRGRQRQSDADEQAGIQAIQKRDPGFQLENLLERSRTAFQKIQSAWSDQELSGVRPFISDGIHERFALQIGMQQAAGLRNVMDQVRIQSASAVAIFSTGPFDTVHIRFQASARDYNVDLKTGRQVSGSDHSGSFVEIWSFCRRPGVQTLKTSGPIEGNCPRCGAVLKVVDQAKCNSCGAQVNSGEYDWVLAEITQESEWQVPGTEQQLPGMAELAAADAGFNLQHIEDRVSVMYWRMRAAEFYRDERYAAPVLSPEFRQKFVKTMTSNQRYWRDPAVGQVELIDAQVNPGGMDQLRVMVRWSGTLIDKVSGRETLLREQTIYTQLYILERKSGTQSSGSATFTSAGCANCGAPISVNETGECVYCGASLTGGDFDWVLSSVDRYSPELAGVHAVHQAEIRAQSPQVLPRARLELPLAVLAHVMMADGVLDPRERAALEKLASHANLTSSQLEQLLQHVQAREIEIPLPQDPGQARAALDQLIFAVLADGQISREEKRIINTYAQRVGLSEYDVQQSINRERERAYQAARKVLGS